jgi:hypothetical protein
MIRSANVLAGPGVSILGEALDRAEGHGCRRLVHCRRVDAGRLGDIVGSGQGPLFRAVPIAIKVSGFLATASFAAAWREDSSLRGDQTGYLGQTPDHPCPGAPTANDRRESCARRNPDAQVGVGLPSSGCCLTSSFSLAGDRWHTASLGRNTGWVDAWCECVSTGICWIPLQRQN